MKTIDIVKIVVFTAMALLLTNCPHNRTTSRIEDQQQEIIRKVDSSSVVLQELIIKSHLSNEKKIRLIVRQELLNFLIKETDLDRGKATLSDIQRDLEVLEELIEQDTAIIRK